MEENATSQANSNKTYLYVAVGVGVLVLLVGVLVSNSQIKRVVSPAPVEVVAPAVTSEPVATDGGKAVEEVVVEKTNAGFSPKEITVKKGTTVKFVNKTTTPMWVASAPHPAHTDYPEFDQKVDGSPFRFVFTKVGSWKYHNHSPFGPGGTVVVTE